MFAIEQKPRASSPKFDVELPLVARAIREAAVERTESVGSQISGGGAMKRLVQEIKGLATRIDEFRKLLYSAGNCQLVLMRGAVKPHRHVD